jgi:hypothetical protein
MSFLLRPISLVVARSDVATLLLPAVTCYFLTLDRRIILIGEPTLNVADGLVSGSETASLLVL